MAGRSLKLLAAALIFIALGLAIWMLAEKPAEEISVSILESVGSCGGGDVGLSLVKYKEGYAEILFREPANTPCHSHVIKNVKISQEGRVKVEIELELKKTAKVCVQCLGIIETRIRIGPLEKGSEIVVNGRSLRI